MAISSMTGFGRGSVTRAGYTVTVEMSAVNRKQFDLRLNSLRSLAVLEPQVAKLVRSKVARGGVTISVQFERDAGVGAIPEVDTSCAQAYVDAARKLVKRCKVPDTMGTAVLLRMPGVMQIAGAGDPDSETIWPLVRDALKQAMAAFLSMRQEEGKSLSQDMSKRLTSMRRLKAKVLKRAPLVVRHYRGVLQKRTAALVHMKTDTGLRDAIAREVALFADRCDISEELVRLDSHIDQSIAHLDAKSPVGRTLEFLCQEMLREINTIGSKANDRFIARWVVELKSELESLREQVQNVE